MNFRDLVPLDACFACGPCSKGTTEGQAGSKGTTEGQAGRVLTQCGGGWGHFTCHGRAPTVSRAYPVQQDVVRAWYVRGTCLSYSPCKRVARTNTFEEVCGAIFLQKMHFALKSVLFHGNHDFHEKIQNVGEMNFPMQRMPQNH